MRKTPEDERSGWTYKKEFQVKIHDKETHTAYLTVNFYGDGSNCEFFITVGKIEAL